MKYQIETIPYFQKRAKRLIKKFPSLKKELLELHNKLSADPETGTALGKNCYKIRLAIKSKNKGKSGGARVITYLYIRGKVVYLLDIYDKSEQSDITNKELIELLSEFSNK